MSGDQYRLLIVDDEADFGRGLARHVGNAFDNITVERAQSGQEALEKLNAFFPDVMLLDLHMPDMHGMEVLEEALRRTPELTVIVLTAHGTVETAVSSLKSGAWDFLTKPVRREDLLRCLAKACERSRLLGENKRLSSLMAQSDLNRMLVGDTPAMRRLKESIHVVASSNYTVLIRGESGTGKELVARSIHALSDRRQKPLSSVNCPAIPEQLLESELFGHIKGAFTGATATRKGIFADSSGSTLVLDEIGDIPLSIQTKLLRALQEGEVRPVGSSHALKVDTRIIAVTNQDLERKIRDGSFREDLFYRLNVLPLRIPSLRERRDDIPLLAGLFLSRTCREINVAEKSFSTGAMSILCRREWPGNVRELQNVVRRVALFCGGPVVEPVHLGFDGTSGEGGEWPGPVAEATSYKEAKSRLVDSFTRRYVTDLLKQNGGNVSETARVSGLERVSLQKILKRLDINPGLFRR